MPEMTLALTKTRFEEIYVIEKNLENYPQTLCLSKGLGYLYESKSLNSFIN
jgi:hypothetical protein